MMQDFGKIVRTLLTLKNCSLDDAKELAREPETKQKLEDLKSIVQKTDPTDPHEKRSKKVKPNLISSTAFIQEKPKMLELIKRLGLESLPSPVITVQKNPTSFGMSGIQTSKLQPSQPQNEERFILSVINTGPVSGPMADERIEENDSDQIVLHSFGDRKPQPMESLVIKDNLTPLQLSPSPRFG